MSTPCRSVDELDVARRRERALGPGLRQFYDTPFMPVRGRGVWLEDATGRRFLDAYNNVAHVGHCHPSVVEATARQLAELNTNTRYLHPLIVEYGERLLATMPPALDTCFVTCTGSDANDLAWRLATESTGRQGAIATDDAYHGSTSAISQLGNPAGRASAPWVATIPPPPHRLGSSGAPGAGSISDQLRSAAGQLGKSGFEPAAVFFDSVFYSSGLRVPDPSVMRELADTANALGALTVADEVQSGHGRVGSSMWGFELFGITPDIVTMGKPTAGGFPVGVVITRRAIAEAFFGRSHYFNTYAGNPVAAAAGLAVLDVLERESLLDNARDMGALLLGALDDLRSTVPLIAEVRGAGLAIGVDLRGADGRPATAQARRAINDMLRAGVLIGLAGPQRNVLKIRPPMIFDRSHVETLVGALQDVLSPIELDQVAD